MGARSGAAGTLLRLASPVKHPARNSQILRGKGFIAAGSLQHRMNDGVFEVAQRTLTNLERQMNREWIGFSNGDRKRRGRLHLHGRHRRRYVVRKMGGIERWAVAEDHRSFDEVAQFPHITGIVIGLEQLLC